MVLQAEEDGDEEIAEIARACQRDRAIFEFRNYGMRSMQDVVSTDGQESEEA